MTSDKRQRQLRCHVTMATTDDTTMTRQLQVESTTNELMDDESKAAMSDDGRLGWVRRGWIQGPKHVVRRVLGLVGMSYFILFFVWLPTNFLYILGVTATVVAMSRWHDRRTNKRRAVTTRQHHNWLTDDESTGGMWITTFVVAVSFFNVFNPFFITDYIYIATY